MSKVIERQIKKIYNEVFKKVFNKNRINSLSEGNRVGIEYAIIQLKNSSKYDEFCRKFSKALAQKGLNSQKGIWRKYFEAARKSRYIALPKTFNEFENKVLETAIKQNFEAIKSIPDKILEIVNHKYTTTLIEEVAKGNLNRGSFKKQLEKHGIKNAGVIARTETAKLQSTILENRATSLGSIAYEWLSSNDKRTRPSHKAMNGVIVFWRPFNLEQPLLDNMYGNAGCFPNCRCSPNPILDEDDLTKSSYRVYDYRNHTIINMSKKELISSLEKGSL